MGEDISVALKMTDNLTDAAARMKGNLTSMRTDVGALRTEMTALNDRKLELVVKMESAKKALDEAKKAFKTTGDEASKLAYQTAYADYSNVSDELKLISTQATLTKKDINDAMDTFRRANEQAEKGSALGQIAQAGLFNQAGQALAGTAATLLTSGLSSDVGSVAGAVFDGAINGASMGMLSGNPMIALAGAAIGAGSSLISGVTQVYENQSEAMKSYVSDLYSSVTQATLDGLEAGMATAGSRETTMVSFSTLLGSAENAAAYLEQVKDLANTTPFLYDDLTGMSKTLLTYGFDQSALIPTLTAVGDTGAALGMDTTNMNMVVTALGRMKTTDKTSLEYLNLLSERGIGAVDWLARRDNISVSDVYANISAGNYSGKETADYIVSMMSQTYGGMMAEQSQTFEGLSSTLEGLTGEVENAMGEGYNDLRKEGLQGQISYLSGEIGQAWQAANELVGQSQAYLDNLKDEYGRQAMTALFTGEMGELLSPESVEQLQGMHEQYLEQMSIARGDDEEAAALAGQQIGALMETAQALGENEYTVSDAALAVVDIQEQQVDALRENTEAIKAWKPSYDLQQTQSRGMNLIDRVLFGGDAESVNASLSSTQDDIWDRLQGSANGYASGLERVPRTGLYLLHEDERVQRAAEVGGGGGVSVKVSVGQLVVREEADVQKVAEALLEEARLRAMAGVYET